MLVGFEEHTQELTDFEKNLIPVFLKGFATKHGKDNSVTNRQIVQKLKSAYPKISEVRVRKIINHIRKNNLIPGLVADSRGYYVTHDPEEVKRYIHSLAGRESEIRKVRECFYEYLSRLQHEK
jgi:hypothetical protein